MSYIKPSTRLYEILDVPEAVALLDQYAPGVSEYPRDSNNANCSIYRLIKDSYSDVQKELFWELEQIEY